MLLSGCSNVSPIVDLKAQDFWCHSIDMEEIDAQVNPPHDVSCGATLHFDTPFGHKLPGEK